MARKASTNRNKKNSASKSSRSSRSTASSPLTLDEWLVRIATPWRIEIVGLILVIVGVWTALCLLDLPLGNLADWLRSFLRQVLWLGAPGSWPAL